MGGKTIEEKEGGVRGHGAEREMKQIDGVRKALMVAFLRTVKRMLE